LTKNPGKEFEEQLKASAQEQGVYFYRIKDVPTIMLKQGAQTSQNDFDSFIYKKPNLFPIELKSTAKRSVAFQEKIIKKHQIEALEEANKYDGVIAGFIFNFREYENFTVFVHIKDFLEIKYLSEHEIKEHRFKSKLNKSSIGLDICKEVGIEIRNVKKIKKYRYYINSLLDSLIDTYNSK
jgi:penicillin-binding protein-related factor A (putative recombinase)